MRFWLIFVALAVNIASLPAEVDSSAAKKIDRMIEEYYNVTYNNPDSAYSILDSAESLSKKTGYLKGFTAAVREKGIFFSERGKYVRSMTLLLSALKEDEQITNNDGIGMDLLFIGLNYFQQEKLNESLLYMQKALKKYTDIKDEAGVTMIKSNLGMVYRNMNKFEIALEYYYSCRDFYVKAHNEKNLAHIENNIGNIYKDLLQYDKALEHFFVSRDLVIKGKDTYYLINTLSNIADVYVEKKEFDKAYTYYAQALKIADEMKTVALQKDVHSDLAYAYEKQGDYKKALENLKLYNKLKDSIISEHNNKDLADMRIKYDSEKKENENKILTKDNELQEIKITQEKKQKVLFASLAGIVFLAGLLVFVQYRNKQKLSKQLTVINEKVNNQNVTLRTLNKELIDSEENLMQANSTKDQLISMLSHDLYNPVTSVINYTSQINELSGKMSKEELGTSFQKVNNAVVPLQDLLDNILQWARVQKNRIEPVIEKTDLNKVVAEIVQLYKPSAELKNVTMDYVSENNMIAAADRLMIYFIIRNIINNAVKFSASAAKITIEMTAAENAITVAVKDQGKGFDTDTLVQLNSRSENVLIASHGTGIGLSVSRQFIKLLNGKMEFKNRNEGGAEVLVIIPRV